MVYLGNHTLCRMATCSWNQNEMYVPKNESDSLHRCTKQIQSDGVVISNLLKAIIQIKPEEVIKLQ
jgi:hypothetical protein